MQSISHATGTCSALSQVTCDASQRERGGVGQQRRLEELADPDRALDAEEWLAREAHGAFLHRIDLDLPRRAPDWRDVRPICTEGSGGWGECKAFCRAFCKAFSKAFSKAFYWRFVRHLARHLARRSVWRLVRHLGAVELAKVVKELQLDRRHLPRAPPPPPPREPDTRSGAGVCRLAPTAPEWLQRSRISRGARPARPHPATDARPPRFTNVDSRGERPTGGAATHAASLGSHVARAGQRSRDLGSKEGGYGRATGRGNSWGGGDLGAEELEVLLGELVVLEEAQLRARATENETVRATENSVLYKTPALRGTPGRRRCAITSAL